MLQVWLQDIAWSEEQKPARLAKRAAYAEGPAERALLEHSSMFCFETALIALRWCQLAYLGAPCWAGLRSSIAGAQQAAFRRPAGGGACLTHRAGADACRLARSAAQERAVCDPHEAAPALQCSSLTATVLADLQGVQLPGLEEAPEDALHTSWTDDHPKSGASTTSDAAQLVVTSQGLVEESAELRTSCSKGSPPSTLLRRIWLQTG